MSRAAATKAVAPATDDAEAPRRRRGWDIGLSILFLVLAVAVGALGFLFAVLSLAFADSCGVTQNCDVDAAVSSQFTAGLVVVLAFLVGLIATIVVLAARRRAWWVALLTLVAVIVAWFLGFFGYFVAVDWQ